LIDLPIRELYELGADPKELRNVAASQAARVDMLTKVLATFNLDAPNRPVEETAAARERLRALGYTGGSPVTARERYTDADDPKRLIELDKRLHRASEAYLAGKPAEAAAIYQDLIKQRPDLADAYRSLAFMLWQAGQRQLAIATLEMAMKNGVTQRDMHVKLGLYLAETGESAKAIALLATLPQDDTEALNALGIAYGHARRPADAMRMFTRAIELDATDGLAHQNIGTLQLQANDLKNAEASLRRALAIDPTLAGAHTSLGVVLAQTGRAAEAIDEWKRAVDLDPTDFDGLFNLTLELVKQGRMDEARNYGGKYLATAPPSVYGQDLARVRQMLGR
jgi:Flp pilus assembly protein TadD